MKKFVLYIDYKANEGPACGYAYKKIEAKDLMEAIQKADNAFSQRVYLMQIMEKTGKVEKEEGGWKNETFEAVLCRRSYGWHRNTKENSEAEHIAKRHYKGNIEYIAIA